MSSGASEADRGSRDFPTLVTSEDIHNSYSFRFFNMISAIEVNAEPLETDE